MKKFILLAAVIVTGCLSQVSAQSNVQVSKTIEARFSKEFKEATDVKWTKLKNIFQSRFYLNQEYCLAYFDASGELILSGRKIPFEITPMAVKKELERIRNASEKRDDILSVAEVYELNDADGTKYFVNLDSQTLSMSVMTYGNGHSEILKKVNNPKMASDVLVTRQH